MKSEAVLPASLFSNWAYGTGVRGNSSLTALLVAFGRGVGVSDKARDARAGTMLVRPLGALVDLGSSQGSVRSLLRLATLGMVDHVTLRMLAIDQALGHAIEDGCAQVVILGAGLDARASRHRRGGVRFFEVDHPATQAHKRSRVSIDHAATFVSVDFEQDDLFERLERSGHDPSIATVWIWEGVTMYLASQAINNTLDKVAGRSAERSVVIASYLEPDVAPAVVQPFIEVGFRALGEPLLGLMERDEMRQRLDARGFTVRSDGNCDAWAADHSLSPRLARAFAAERLVVARR